MMNEALGYMKGLRIRLSAWLLLLSGLCWIGCQGTRDGTKKIAIAYPNWSEGIAMSHLAKVVLEDQGYHVRLLNADIAPIFVSLAKGRADVFMDCWLPVTHADYMKQYEEHLEILGQSFVDARVGLVVPDYVAIGSIEELNGAKEKFDDAIVGIDVGAGIMEATEKAIAKYALQLKLKPSSGSAMTAMLNKSIDKKDWTVVTGWTPHWMFSRFALKFLEDPENVYGDAEIIHTIATKGFSVRDPFAARFFANFKLTSEQLSDLMFAVEESGGKESFAVRKWYEKNKALVDGWLPGASGETTGQP